MHALPELLLLWERLPDETLVGLGYAPSQDRVLIFEAKSKAFAAFLKAFNDPRFDENRHSKQGIYDIFEQLEQQGAKDDQ